MAGSPEIVPGGPRSALTAPCRARPKSLRARWRPRQKRRAATSPRERRAALLAPRRRDPRARVWACSSISGAFTSSSRVFRNHEQIPSRIAPERIALVNKIERAAFLIFFWRSKSFPDSAVWFALRRLALRRTRQRNEPAVAQACRWGPFGAGAEQIHAHFFAAASRKTLARGSNSLSARKIGTPKSAQRYAIRVISRCNSVAAWLEGTVLRLAAPFQPGLEWAN